MNNECFSVILAGGKGTRFWPLSRSQRPKQLLKILSRRSLIRETADRVLPLSGRSRTLVVTVAEQMTGLRKELRILPRKNFLAEPRGNNTAPCIGLAALEVSTQNPAALMIILPADHWIADVKSFRRTLNAAVKLAQTHDSLVTIGIRPDYPETGYGYILKGKRLGGGGANAYEVRRFKEKPSLKEARKLIAIGSLWNSGIFVWRAATILELLNRYQPAIFRALKEISKAARKRSLVTNDSKLRGAIAREYKKMPNISIDHAVLERAGSDGRVVALEAGFGWSDVGSWAAVHRMLPKDQNDNAGIGRWLAFGAKNCLVHAPDRLVVLLSLRDAFVVDTEDALLVGDLTRSQEVRELIEALKRHGYGTYT
jgi:mannose-1-phosphate guanylyltransferase